MKVYNLSQLKHSRLLYLRNTGLPAWLAPILLQPGLEWQSDFCMSRKWGCLRNVQHSQEDWLFGEVACHSPKPKSNFRH